MSNRYFTWFPPLATPIVVDRSDFQNAAGAQARQPRHQLNCVIQIAGLEHQDAARLANGFVNRAGGDGHLAVLEAKGRRHGGAPNCRSQDVVASLPEHLVVRGALGPQRFTLRRGHRVPGAGVVIGETEVSHRRTPRSHVARHCATMIIHDTPNRSATMPNRGEKKVLVIGICTWPPAARALNMRSAAGASPAEIVSEMPSNFGRPSQRPSDAMISVSPMRKLACMTFSGWVGPHPPPSPPP